MLFEESVEDKRRGDSLLVLQLVDWTVEELVVNINNSMLEKRTEESIEKLQKKSRTEEDIVAIHFSPYEYARNISQVK
jgi:hypothetical protein